MAEETQQEPEALDAEVTEPDPDDPWTPFQHVTEEWMREKYKHPDEALKSLSASRRQQTEAEQRARDLERYVQQMDEWVERQGMQPYQPGQTPQQQPQVGQPGLQQGFNLAAIIRQTEGLIGPDGEIDAERLAAVMEVNNVVQNQMLMQAVAEQMAAAIGTYDQERVNPIATRTAEEHAARELADLEDRFGDDFDAVAEVAERMHNEDPTVQEAGGLKALFGLAYADLQRQRSRLRAMEARGYTIDEGGRPKPPPPRKSQVEMEKDALEAMAHRRGSGGVI